jgi:tetratricopeptide (TPR) repeat protein
MDVGSRSPSSRQDFPIYNSMEFDEGTFGAEGAVGEASPGYRRSRHQTSPKSSGQQSTQLATRVPELDTPQRVEAPASMRPPERRPMLTRNDTVRTAFKPESLQKSKGKYDISSYGGGQVSPKARKTAANASKKKKKSFSTKAFKENFGEIKTRLRDFELLAQSCRRAEKLEQEGGAYFCSGILYDNMGDLHKAISMYKRFVSVCQQTNDVAGAALAFNCIGVNYITLGQGGEADDGSIGARVPESAELRQHLENAVQFHTQHLQVADERGQFVAHCNLGLANDRLGEYELAARHHQDALRIAIHLNSTHGQCISVGNLGLVGIRQGDLATARACLDQHLQLVRSMRDPSAESSACQYLGLLSNMQGEFAQAARFFEEARQLATGTGETGMMKLASCSLGMASANLRLEEHMQGVVAAATKNERK